MHATFVQFMYLQNSLVKVIQVTKHTTSYEACKEDKNAPKQAEK